MLDSTDPISCIRYRIAPGRCAVILLPTNREKDVSILPGNGDRTLQPALSQVPVRPALRAVGPTTRMSQV